MVRKIILVLIVFVICSCRNRSTTNLKDEIGSESQSDIQEKAKDWKSEIIRFEVRQIDLSREQFLSDESLIKYLEDESISKGDKDFVVNVILLKLYLYHLKRANQGYNLITMRNGNAKFIIDYFFKENSISTDEEFVNSAVAYNLMKKDTLNSAIINELMNSIESELTANE